jgi:hypothetical protein
MYLFLFAFTLMSAVLVRPDICANAKKTIKKKYSEFRDVNKLVETTDKNIFKILYISVSMIMKMYWMNFLQYINNSIEIVDNKTAIISYVWNGQKYRFVTHARRGPCDILSITDDLSNNITNEVLHFYGPSRDWHGNKFTPSFWKKRQLVFQMVDGECKTFSEKEVINI